MLRIRLLISLFLLIAGCGYYLISWIVDELRPRYLEAVEESLVDEAEILAAILSESSSDTLNITLFKNAWNRLRERHLNAKIYNMHKTLVDLQVYITDSTGRVLYHSDSSAAIGADYSKWRDVILTLKSQYGARATRVEPQDPRTTSLFVAAPIIKHEKIIGVLTVCKPTASINTFIETARPKMIGAGILALGTLLLLTGAVSLWLTQPLRKLTLYAKSVRDGKRQNLPRLGKGEIAEFGLAFEEMREALEGKRSVEHYVQTLTHEIKSPLAGILGASELLQEELPNEEKQKFLQNIKSESHRIQEIVEKLLSLSALEAQKSLNDPKPINLSDLLINIIDSMLAQAENYKVKFSLQINERITVLGEEFWLRMAIVNLLQNALEFSPENSEITVTLKEIEYAAKLSIVDQGPGIPNFAKEKIFDRFFSLEHLRSRKKGSGLGLPMVREIALLHNGSVDVRSHSPQGTCASLRLPLG